jgi:hypothetical protein
VTISGLQSKNWFCFQGDVVKVTCIDIWEIVCSVFAPTFYFSVYLVMEKCEA